MEFHSSTAVVGYITMTADMVHEDHIRLLKSCRQQCDILIVGLVTDELAVKQKRVPLMGFNHRRAILENFPFVDLVVRHSGESKHEAYRKLKFNVLFSSDEYLDSYEHDIFESQHPEVRCIYFPKNSSVSTTSIINNLSQRINHDIISIGISGPIYRSGIDGNLVLKPVNFSALEMSNSTNDVFGMYRLLGSTPRNYPFDLPEYMMINNESSVRKSFPMIAGVNSNREIYINEQFKDRPWSLYLDNKTVYVDNNENSVPEIHSVEDIVNTRRFPVKIVHLIQRYVPMTLLDYYKKHHDVSDIVEKVRDIIEELRKNGVVHGDMHPRNVLVNDKTKQPYLIDFGWVASLQFQMCEAEKRLLVQQLEHNFDWFFFQKSIENEML